MEIEISKLKTEEDKFLGKDVSIKGHPNYWALIGSTAYFQKWCEFLKQDWRERMFRLLWVYMFLKEEGQTLPIDIDKNFKIITGHKRAAAMLALGHKKIEVRIINYKEIGRKK